MKREPKTKLRREKLSRIRKILTEQIDETKIDRSNLPHPAIFTIRCYDQGWHDGFIDGCGLALALLKGEKYEDYERRVEAAADQALDDLKGLINVE